MQCYTLIMFNHLIEWLIREEDAPSDIRPYIEHGLRILIQDSLCFLSVLIFAICTDCLPLAIMFICYYSVLRVHVGGWHAHTRTGCLILYFAEFIVCFFLRKEHIPLYMDFPLCIGIAYLFLNSPFQHQYNPLTRHDQLKNQHIARITCIVYYIIYAWSRYIFPEMSVCIYCVICFISLLAWVQKHSIYYLPNGENNI